jgi:hypothetical protein
MFGVEQPLEGRAAGADASLMGESIERGPRDAGRAAGRQPGDVAWPSRVMRRPT